VSGRQKDQSSMDTQKSVGKKIGIVSEFGKGWFSIKGKEVLVNGDGICFINPKGILTGLRVNRVEATKIFPYGEMKELKVGVEIFRNHDHEFSNALKSSNKNRWLGCSIKVEQTNSGLVFTATDEDDHSIILSISEKFDRAMNSEKSIENIIHQLSRSGDTIFKIQKVDVLMEHPVFIPTSTINQIRRNLLDGLINRRLYDFSKPLRNRIDSQGQYISSNLTYKANVSNRLANAFYHRHGVSSIDNAFELQKATDVELMVTRYCIKYEIGICPTKQKGKQTGELYLRDSNNLYPLEFDCKNCMMKVKSKKI